MTDGFWIWTFWLMVLAALAYAVYSAACDRNGKS